MSMKACTVFTTALCNLNCSYCYICKDQNGGLKEIDKDIENSFNDKSLIKSVSIFDENIGQELECITLWGGEPFLHMERFTNQIQDWFKAFPNLIAFNTSTNFTVPDEIEKLEHLLDNISKYGPKDRYNFEFQVSIDGYPEMNDFGRGKGVTEKFLKNWEKLLQLNYDSQKINLVVTTKQTLSKQTFQFVDSQEKCNKWASFFNEALYKPYAKARPRFNFHLALYNHAAPTEWTKEDGLEFAKISQYFANLNPKDYEGWSNFYSLLPMAQHMIECEINNKNFSKPMCGGSCGAFSGSIVPIPNGKYSVCHRGLFDSYVDYCNATKNKEYMNGLSKNFFSSENRDKWVLSLEELRAMHKNMSKINCCEHSIMYTDYIITIREYARAGIIDAQYLDIKNIEKTLFYYLNRSFCMQDSLIQTGSWLTMSSYEVPLMYNGAMEVASEVSKNYMEKVLKGE